MSLATGTKEASRRMADWEAPPSSYPARDRLALVTLIAVPALLVALVAAVFTGTWWLGALLLALWVLKTTGEARWTDVVLLRRLGARRLQPEEEPRLANLTSGVAGDLGVPSPRLYVTDGEGPNALVASGGGHGILAVTRPLLETFTRTELEAVVAHCLLRLHSKNFVYSNLAARWSDLGAGLAPRVGLADDVRAAALTRYPPALAAAIEKCDDNVKLYAPIWFVSNAPSHDPSARRAAAVADL